MRRAETSKPTLWCCQQRYLSEGFTGLKRMARVDNHGSFKIVQRTQTSKPTLWRGQQRYFDEGVAGASSGVIPGHYRCRLCHEG